MKVSLRGVDVRQNAVIDILLIIVFSLFLLICGKVSAGTGWQSGGDFQGVVEFGGTITPYDLLLLAGKSARAFEGSETSGAGIVPVIQLKGSDGSEIHIQWARGTPGQGLLVLPLSVTGDIQTAGTLAAEVQAFGALAWAEDDGFGARITQALGNNSADAYVFNGGVPDSSTWRTADGLSFISRMTEGEVSAESIWTQLKQGVPGVSDSPVITDESGYQDLVGEGWFYSGAYALGISSGAVLNLHFSKPVTGQSVWRAGMTVIIRYA